MSHGTRFYASGIVRWHERLTGKASLNPDGKQTQADREDGGLRGERAELKRVEDSSGVMLSPTFAALIGSAYPVILEGTGGPRGVSGREIEALARTAMILAHVDRCQAERTVPEALAAGRERPAVSEARVAALFRTQDVEDAARQIRVMIPMITGGVDPVCLHEALGSWDRHRKDWAVGYHLARLKAKRPADKAA